MKPPNYRVYVVSHKRPQNVEAMQGHIGNMPTTWIVPPGQAEDYRDAGAKHVKEIPRILDKNSLCTQRNYALERAFRRDRVCIMVSDDLKALHYVKADGTRKRHADKEDISFKKATMLILKRMNEVDAYLGGVSPTNNPFFVTKPVNTHHFILCDLMVFRPNPIRFNPKMRIKDDYYITCEHLKKYKKVCRVDEILTTFEHYKNPGGVAEYRTDKLEARECKYLMEDFPNWIRLNPRRKNQVILKYKE